MRIEKPARFSVAMIVISLLAAGCVQNTESPSRVIGSPYSVDQTLSAFEGYSADYDPRRSPDEIAENSSLVVQGKIASMRSGRTESAAGNDALAPYTTIVLVLENISAIVGTPPKGSAGRVYVELVNPGNRQPSEYDEAFPRGSDVVAYLSPAFDGVAPEGTDIEIDLPLEGRPAGQPLYQPSGPQSLIMQATPDDDVVWPLIGAHKAGKIVEALPGGSLIAE